MAEDKIDTRPLAEREAEAREHLNDLRSDANDARDRLDGLGRDVTGLEVDVAALDDKVFDLAVQQSGAMDLMNGPIVNDDDATGGVIEIVETRLDDVRGDLLDVHDRIVDARADLTDLETDLTDMIDRADVVVAEVDAVRADGGHIEGRLDDEDAYDPGFIEDQLDEPAHAE